MWGNLQGWMIAAVLGIGLSLGLYWLATMNHVSIPTPEGQNPEVLKPIAFRSSPTIVTPMTTPGDAGDLYRQAIDDVRKYRKDYEDMLVSGALKRIQKLRSIKFIADAAPMSSMKLLAADPQANVGYFPGNISPDLADFEKAGLSVEKLGLQYFTTQNYEEAKKQFAAEFSLGYKLFSERVTFKEAEKGIGFMRASIRMLLQTAQLQKDENRFRELQEIDSEIGVIFEQLVSQWKIVYSVDEKIVSAHVGDIFLFASDKMQERMWRTEAILKVGRFKYNAGGATARLSDQRAADLLLKQLDQAETDPVLKAAIHAAQNLTLEQFRAIE